MIKLKNVSKFYRDSNNNIATGLKKINLEFNKGEFVAITGESGSGKSTLLNVISGIYSYEEGEMYFKGQDTSFYGKEEWENYRRNYIGFVYQNYNLIDSYTVLQNVECALLISGRDDEEVKEKALKYIEKVGLMEYKNKRASNLSSGQKQRLAIARALAKETDIIVADEPTGNLDVENGRQIVEIFKELSKDHLVIMVTHNYEQVKDLATRKIRLYNSEVAEDIILDKSIKSQEESDVKEYADSVKDESHSEKALTDMQEPKKKYMKQVMRFVKINKFAQPKRNLLILIAYAAIMAGIFVFLGSFIENSDDASAKIYSSTVMANGDKTRIEIVKGNGKSLTNEDIGTIKNIPHIRYIDLYDAVNDINYYYKENEDYIYEHHKQNSIYDLPDETTVEFLKNDKFMRSVTCLEEENITAGEIADGRYEVVVSQQDKELLGKTVTFYFMDNLKWAGESYIGVDMKVVGVSDLEENQCYFSEAFCSNLSVDFKSINSAMYTMGYTLGCGALPLPVYNELGNGTHNQMLSYINDCLNSENFEFDSSANRGAVFRHYQAIFIINEDLNGNQIILSPNFYARTFLVDTFDKMDERILQYYIYNRAAFIYSRKDEEGKKVKFGEEVEIIQTINKSSSQIIEVSREFFDKIVQENRTTQACIYIEDYAYTDVVTSDLTSAGFDNMSVFRVGAKEYDKDVVMEKLRIVCISIAAIVALFFIGVIMIHIMMKLKKKDYDIYTVLGMQEKLRLDIIRTDLMSSALAANTVVLIVAMCMYIGKHEIVTRIMKYYRWYHICILYIMVIVMVYLTAGIYNRYLRKKQRMVE